VAQDGAEIDRFEQLSDIFGFRVVVENVEDCYRVIGVVHTKWAVVPGRFKDYISTPKQKRVIKSGHTTVVGPGRQRAELQVRTAQMHDIARNGIAAHALYKDGRIAGKESLTSESRSLPMAAPHGRSPCGGCHARGIPGTYKARALS